MLSPKCLETIDYIEQEYLISGAVPSLDKVNEVIPTAEKTWKEYWKNDEFTGALEVRGITVSTRVKGRQLTAEQLAAVNAMLDPIDLRTDKKKLEELGIPYTKFAGWMRDPAFNKYYSDRSEQIFSGAKGDILKAHIGRAKSGDTKAIELYYEMTDRYKRNAENIDIPRFIMFIIDVMSRHIKNPEILNAISQDIMSFSGLNTTTIDAEVINEIAS